MRHPRDVDRETRELYRAWTARERYRTLIAALEAVQHRVPVQAPDVVVVLVPGILYRQYPATGADGAMLEQATRRLGTGFATVPLDGTHGLEQGAARLIEWLGDRRGDRRMVLVSLSKGSAEVRQALLHRDAPDAFSRVTDWISVSGLPFGTPAMAATMASRWRRLGFDLLCRARRWPLDMLEDVVAYRPRARFQVPPHLRVLHLVACPLHSHLGDRRSRRLHRALSPYGPNDGFVCLNDLDSLPGTLFPLWGADHYLRGVRDLQTLLVRMLGVTMQARRIA